ncbi:unnamed protein product, partial [Ranitomeya imitator]
MTPSFNMNAVDNLFQDICGKKRPFGGKVFINGGDFRQTLPIVEGGKRAQIVQSTIKYSKSWNQFSRFQLQQNMRASQEEVEYNSWLLKLGNGELSNVYGLPKDTNEIPNSFIEEVYLIPAIFGDSIEITDATVEAIANKAILTPLNDDVHALNDKILSQVQ